jgi:hypothetical protein
MITLSESFRALFYTPFYAALAIGLMRRKGSMSSFVRPPTRTVRPLPSDPALSR